jgi:hypothetical protein
VILNHLPDVPASQLKGLHGDFTALPCSDLLTAYPETCRRFCLGLALGFAGIAEEVSYVHGIEYYWALQRGVMSAHKNYQSYLIESLQDPQEAAAYLSAATDEGSIDGALTALQNLAEAYGHADLLLIITAELNRRSTPTSRSSSNPSDDSAVP